VLRHSPAIATLLALVHSGRLGRPMAAALCDDQYFPIQGQYASGWRADVTQAGGGTLIEHSIHDIDLLGALLGPIHEVSASTANFAGHPGIEDVAAVTLRHRSGATSSLTSVWHSILGRQSTRHLQVIGETGIATLTDEHAGNVTVLTDRGTEEIPPTFRPAERELVEAVMDAVDLPEPFRGSLASYALADAAFLDAVHRGRAPQPGLDIALEAHRVCDAAYRDAGPLRAAEGGN
jgi:predicted dehydrogenase